MTTPFFRGGDRFDWFFLSLLAQCQLHDNPALGRYLIEGFEESQTFVWADAVGLLPGYTVSIGATTVVIGIEGTIGPFPFAPQWMANLLGSFQSTIPPFPGAVCTFFATAAAIIAARITPTVAPHFSNRRFVFTGHSMGGAVAQLLYAVMSPLCVAGASCMVLGAPRVGDPIFAAHAAAVLRLQNTGDPVPGLPPVLWAASPSTFPTPGLGPLAVYTHAGSGQTLDELGTLDNSDNPPSVADVVTILKDRSYGVHFTEAYSERLARGLSDLGATLGDSSGYADPKRLTQVFQEFSPQANQQEELPHMFKVTSFYRLGAKGYTYSYYDAQSNATQLRDDFKIWLGFILSLECKPVEFLYVRYSNLAVPRQVFWDTPASLAMSPFGQFNANVAQEDDALLLRGTTIAPSNMRIFFHGYPEALVTNEVFAFSNVPSWKTKFLQFTNWLTTFGTYVLFKSINEGAKTAPLDISSASPNLHRGFNIVPAVNTTVVKGDIVYISMTSSTQGAGWHGRKVVTKVATGGANFDVGGAVPIGSIGGEAQYVKLPPQFAPCNYLQVERYTEHRVGKVFGVRPGRNPNLIPLRR